MAESTRVVGYVRVSTSEQADSGLGMDAQRAAIVAEADRRGWTLVDVLVDAGQSGGKAAEDRPGLAAALAAVRAGDADALVVAKLDRLSRSLTDFAALMDQAQGEGFAVVALDVDVDTTTATGRLVANVMGSVAQWEREVIAERTRAALAAKKAAGARLGRPVALADDVRERIAGEREAGRTLAAIAAGLNADGVPTARGGARWYPSTVRGVLRSLTLDAEAAA